MHSFQVKLLPRHQKNACFWPTIFSPCIWKIKVVTPKKINPSLSIVVYNIVEQYHRHSISYAFFSNTVKFHEMFFRTFVVLDSKTFPLIIAKINANLPVKVWTIVVIFCTDKLILGLLHENQVSTDDNKRTTMTTMTVPYQYMVV